MLFNPNDYSIVFLSYDEPNCEENYQHLLSLRPDALRVHGVKGSDTAHKKCAEISLTSRVSIVDADNFVNSSFFSNVIYLPDSFDMNTSVLSYSGLNNVNGNSYGNGGIKNWPVSLLKSMKTHENGDDTSIDFDFSNYLQLNTVGSEVRINGSKLQAWRAGFREGVKLSLDKHIDWRNHDRLWRWTHVGRDVPNGLYSIHGALTSYHLSRVSNWDNTTEIRDFSFLDQMFESVNLLSESQILDECDKLSVRIALFFDKDMSATLSPEASKEYKDTIAPILRNNDYKPYDIVYVGENNNKLLDRFPNSKKAESILDAAKIATTDYFWCVTKDSIIDDFMFHHEIDFFEQPRIRTWARLSITLYPRTRVLRKRTDLSKVTYMDNI
jgi:hypothetical protein